MTVREFFIAKKPAEKNAFRFKDEKSIERFLSRRTDLDKNIRENLSKVIKREDGLWKIDCLEYKDGENLNPGSIVAFEAVDISDNTPHGINCWVLGKNAKINIVVDENGNEIIYTKASPCSAIEYVDNESFEKFIRNHSDNNYFEENISLNPDGAIIKTSWGESSAVFGTSLCVCYGDNDFNFLNKNTESYAQYYECDEDGNSL